MALFLLCKAPAGLIRLTRIQLLLCCFLLSLIIYFLNGHKLSNSLMSAHSIYQASQVKDKLIDQDLAAVRTVDTQTPSETTWGARLVWGNSHSSASHRAKFSGTDIHIGLLTLLVGTYARFIQRFLLSAETHFLPNQMVTYYILTDNPRTLDPPMELGPGRQMKVLLVSELPGWEGLAYRRMVLIADAIRSSIAREVEYLFCADVDQEFVGTVGEEILGDLVATLHPEFYGQPRSNFPYDDQEESSAFVENNEGDYYYTSELYGGLVSEVLRLARDCSFLILQDEANKVSARELEESYLNRYLIDHRPTCVLSPEYSWWDSPVTATVPKHRIVSLGRQCEVYDMKRQKENYC